MDDKLKRPVVKLAPLFYESVFLRKTGPAMLAAVISRQKSRFGTWSLRNKNLDENSQNLAEILKKIQSSIFVQPHPLKWVFSETVSHRAIKLAHICKYLTRTHRLSFKVIHPFQPPLPLTCVIFKVIVPKCTHCYLPL